MEIGMNWEAIGATGEVVGAMAVIFTLVFLAIQIRSNTNAIRANAQYDIQIRLSDISFQIGYSPENSAIWSKILDEKLSETDLSIAELEQVHWVIRGLLVTYIAAFASYQKGMMPEEQWRIDRDFIRRFVNLPLVKPIIEVEVQQGIINPEFRREVLNQVDKAELSVGLHRV